MNRRFNPKQARDKKGRWTSGVAVVPYARASLRSQTAGINSGVNLTKNYRLSLGAYARVERRTASKIESVIKTKHGAALDRIAKKLAPSKNLEPLVKAGVQAAQKKALRKVLGGQHKVGSNAYARLGTSRVGLPSISIRKGTARVSAKKRNAGIDRYEAAMKGIQQKKAAAKVPRPQRRKKAA